MQNYIQTTIKTSIAYCFAEQTRRFPQMRRAWRKERARYFARANRLEPTFTPFSFDYQLPLALTSEKRSRGRPKTEQPVLHLGHRRHVLSDTEADAINFTAIEKMRFINEYKYEAEVLDRSAQEILKDLCPLYNIPYKTGFDLTCTR